MRAMNILQLVFAFAALLGATHYGAGSRSTVAVLQADFTAGTIGIPRGTMLAERPGELRRLHLEISAPGTGGPADSFTVAVHINGTTACSATLLCSSPAGDYNTDCSDAMFEINDDLHMELTVSACASLPIAVGSLTLFSQ